MRVIYLRFSEILLNGKSELICLICQPGRGCDHCDCSIYKHDLFQEFLLLNSSCKGLHKFCMVRNLEHKNLYFGKLDELGRIGRAAKKKSNLYSQKQGSGLFPQITQD